MSRTERCHNCNGSGRTSVSSACGEYTSHWETCSFCAGTGEGYHKKITSARMCYKCDGTGSIHETQYITHKFGAKTENGQIRKTCPQCRGSGNYGTHTRLLFSRTPFQESGRAYSLDSSSTGENFTYYFISYALALLMIFASAYGYEIDSLKSFGILLLVALIGLFLVAGAASDKENLRNLSDVSGKLLLEYTIIVFVISFAFFIFFLLAVFFIEGAAYLSVNTVRKLRCLYAITLFFASIGIFVKFESK